MSDFDFNEFQNGGHSVIPEMECKTETKFGFPFRRCYLDEDEWNIAFTRDFRERFRIYDKEGHEVFRCEAPANKTASFEAGIAFGQKIKNSAGGTVDTHGVKGKPWVGFDLDGTLATYDKWRGVAHIGDLVKPMCDLIKKLHSDGKDVKIVTARVAPREDGSHLLARAFIARWCKDNLGFIPPITHEKDALMETLYDDRVHAVEPNTGKVLNKRSINMETKNKVVANALNAVRNARLVPFDRNKVKLGDTVWYRGREFEYRGTRGTSNVFLVDAFDGEDELVSLYDRNLKMAANADTSVVTETAVNAGDATTRKFKPNDLVKWLDYKGRYNSAYYFRDNGPDRVTVSLYRDGQGGFLEIPRAWIINSRACNSKFKVGDIVIDRGFPGIKMRIVQDDSKFNPNSHSYGVKPLRGGPVSSSREKDLVLANSVVANALNAARTRNAVGRDKQDEASVETWTSLFENNFLKFQLPKATDKERARKTGEKLIKYVEDSLGSEGGKAQLKKMGWTVQKMRDALEKGLAAKNAVRNADKMHDIDAHGKKLAKGDWVRFLQDLPDVKKGECAVVKYALPGGMIFSTLSGAREVSWDASAVEKMPPIPRSLSEVEAWKKGPRATNADYVWSVGQSKMVFPAGMAQKVKGKILRIKEAAYGDTKYLYVEYIDPRDGSKYSGWFNDQTDKPAHAREMNEGRLI